MNIQKMMQQAQAMQKKMEKLQEEIGNKIFTGVSGGGLVSVSITGKGALQSVRIDDSLMSKDEKDVLEDLIVAAFNNAKKDADDESSSAISGAMGELSLPPGFKLPF